MKRGDSFGAVSGTTKYYLEIQLPDSLKSYSTTDYFGNVATVFLDLASYNLRSGTLCQSVVARNPTSVLNAPP